MALRVSDPGPSVRNSSFMKQRLNTVMCAHNGVECAFTLRYVDLSRQARETRPWAERQTTICSSCKVLVRGLGGRQWKSKWLLLSASTAMQDRLDEYCRGTEEEKIDPFKIYLILIHSASSNWPPYLAYLTEETNKKVGLSSSKTVTAN